ncbi:hypothetical protein GE061_016603 [Apolygus lucorum]|uniref:Uncharacterized protein n=1 Tax=Apolygus lucorum TaxID=248454 RepID=A0A6A4K4M7_APOLU|nr:hypothetical protein GE061_016603 [Apolygus lucorum]
MSAKENYLEGAETKLRKTSLLKVVADILEWNMGETRFAMEGKLLFAQPSEGVPSTKDSRLCPVNAVLVTLGKPTEEYQPEGDVYALSRNHGIKEAALLLIKDHIGKHSLIREPLYLDKCIVSKNYNEQEEVFEVQDVNSKDTYIFKAETAEETRRWFRQLQYHAQGLGAWRQRRNALPNIVLTGLHLRP